MLNRFFITLICFVVLTSCNDVKKPENLISEKQMVNILIDAKLIASANSINKKILEKNGVFPNTYIFEKYNIDSLQFAESNAYYCQDLEQYEKIFIKVKDSLDQLKEKFKTLRDEEQQEANKKSKDSLDAVLKKRDSLKFSNSEKDSLVLKELEENLLIKKELEELEIDEIDEKIKLIEPAVDK